MCDQPTTSDNCQPDLTCEPDNDDCPPSVNSAPPSVFFDGPPPDSTKRKYTVSCSSVSEPEINEETCDVKAKRTRLVENELNYWGEKLDEVENLSDAQHFFVNLLHPLVFGRRELLFSSPKLELVKKVCDRIIDELKKAKLDSMPPPPIPPMPALFIYSACVQKSMIDKDPSLPQNLLFRQIAEKWFNLPTETQQIYEEEEELDKKRYKDDLERYKKAFQELEAEEATDYWSFNQSLF